MQILLPSDVFPPRCGGSGWSAHALALALIRRGHSLTALVPRQGHTGRTYELVEGVPTLRYGYRVPSLPFVKNYFRHERLWPQLAGELVQLATSSQATGAAPLIIHAQHVQTASAAVMAGQMLGVPVVVTVRDHWPFDYFATGLHGDRVPYGRQTWAGLATDLVARLGPGRGVLALPAIPYILAHVRRRQRLLQQADAVIAVSSYIAHKLGGIIAPQRLHIIPNMVDLEAIERLAGGSPASLPAGIPFLLFVGKLEHNKGAHLLVEVFRALGRRELPELVIAGDGPLQAELERELAALGVRTRFLAWVDHNEVLRLLRHCMLLLFPSAWGEPLSRVALEALACGAAILAMPTGGTTDIITDGLNGALAPTPQDFARRLAALLDQPGQLRAFGINARRVAHERFSAEQVVGQVEALYEALIQRPGKR